MLGQTRIQSTFTKDVNPTEDLSSVIVIPCTFERNTFVVTTKTRFGMVERMVPQSVRFTLEQANGSTATRESHKNSEP